MTGLAPGRDARSGWRGAVTFAISLFPLLGGLSAQVWAGDDKARQVTIFGIVATQNSTEIDPKLEKIESQLRKLLPNYGFKLLDVKSQRRVAGQSVSCTLGNGYMAEAVLINALDSNGKVRLRCQLSMNTVIQLETLVKTPPNQLFFCDQELANGQHLVIGIGAR